MLLPRYELKSDESLTVFEFLSVGRKGEIPKIVQYSETNLKDFYNLGFGDKDLQTGEVDDTVISDNGDSQKVLATVAATVFAFTDKYPEAWIYATGSTKSRTRLYRIGLTNNLAEIIEDFELYGLKEGEWQEFAKDVEYEAFWCGEGVKLMKKIEELNKSKLPIVKVDKTLGKYKDKVLFKEKVEKANETLKSVGLPKALQKSKA